MFWYFRLFLILQKRVRKEPSKKENEITWVGILGDRQRGRKYVYAHVNER